MNKQRNIIKRERVNECIIITTREFIIITTREEETQIETYERKNAIKVQEEAI